MESPVGPPGKQVSGQVIMSLQSMPFVFCLQLQLS